MKHDGRYFLFFLLVFGLCLLHNEKVYAAEQVVVVLDPGHGGENLGAEYEGYTEKELNLIVAAAMKKELEKYEGITVYMTREGDKDLSLEERAEYAKDKQADMLYCLHFNMSEEHNKFGAEIWVSAFGTYYQKGYTFAVGEMELLESLGLYGRGIKTRLNEKGEDYYGIIRHATQRDLTAVLIEHCHLDEENDKEFYHSEEKLEQLGRADATAVAKYYGLYSEELGVDYSSYQKPEIPEPSVAVKPDLSEPDICLLEVEQVNEHTGEVRVSAAAQDYDSYILYYSYSSDGGETFSGLQRWEPRESDRITFSMQVPSGIIPELVIKVYNAYDKETESNHVFLPSMNYEEKAVEASSMNAPIPSVIGKSVKAPEPEPREIPSVVPEMVKEEEKEISITVTYFLQVSLVCVGILLGLLLIVRPLIGIGHSKKKRRRKKK